MPEKKQIYRKQIAAHLYLDKLLSSTAINHRIRKSIPRTAKMLSELIQDGHVAETGYARSTRARYLLIVTNKKNNV